MLLPLGVFKGKLLDDWLLRGKASKVGRLLGNYFHLWKSEASLAEPRPQNDRSHKSKGSKTIWISCCYRTEPRKVEVSRLAHQMPNNLLAIDETRSRCSKGAAFTTV
jgi:hypothetical protein